MEVTVVALVVVYSVVVLRVVIVVVLVVLVVVVVLLVVLGLVPEQIPSMPASRISITSPPAFTFRVLHDSSA